MSHQMSLEDIKYVDVHTYDTDYADTIESAFEEGASGEASGMKCLMTELLKSNQKQLLLDILKANLDDMDADYFVVHQNSELESITSYIERLTA